MSCPVLWVKIPFYWSRCVSLRMRSHPEWFFLGVFLPLSIEPLLLWQFLYRLLSDWSPEFRVLLLSLLVRSRLLVFMCFFSCLYLVFWSSTLVNITSTSVQILGYLNLHLCPHILVDYVLRHSIWSRRQLTAFASCLCETLPPMTIRNEGRFSSMLLSWPQDILESSGHYSLLA